MRTKLMPFTAGRSLTRRTLLSALAASNLAAICPARAWEDDERAEAASSAIDAPKLIIGGGPDSLPGQVAPILATALAKGLAAPSPIATHYDLGRDGVTAANLFDTVSPEADGGTTILAPGAALIASLAGDGRVHFDFSRWAALIMARRPVVTIARAELHRTIRSRLSGLFHDRPVRLAVSHPTGVELASLLGLSLLGLHPLPVSGYATKKAALDALKNGDVDAVQLTPGPGDDLSADIASAPQGIKPIFYSGPVIPGVPDFEATYLMARGHAPSGALYQSWLAVANAAASALVLALPMLTPPLAVARWRHAAQEAVNDPALKSWNDSQHLTITAGADAAPLLNQLEPELTALLALRRWINNNQPRWRQGQETRPT
ncbi:MULTISPECIES: hypothetical protein [Asaia]|uniref:Tripartite-type tricarboxylate transporter receptor subunit TctC n=2 Tax=Asaia TaxID=91914 RepID=A0ABQ1LDH6_9PROT|nr:MULTISPECIES: hypothetical protein [Asaia]GBR08354.1 hypothetical protein AA0323_2099 [Asaia siamensis NRIC 0323]GBR13675.1 hypothetical protein AA105894_0884 [Asaia spathodeae NBRC 105894]GGC22954.1 hypothetical protein GCM10007207_05300 [Asaia siamensis]